MGHTQWYALAKGLINLDDHKLRVSSGKASQSLGQTPGKTNMKYFPFLRLAPEMRNAIYEELLLMPKVYDSRTSRIYPDILTTCHQIYEEAATILYGTQEHVVYIDDTMNENRVCLWKKPYYYPVGELRDLPFGLRKMTKVCVYVSFDIPSDVPDEEICSPFSTFFVELCQSLVMDHQLQSMRVVWQTAQGGRSIWPGAEQYLLTSLSLVNGLRNIEFVGRVFDMELLEQVREIMASKQIEVQDLEVVAEV
ncbi:hypothetical protein MMC24_003439 [Lignoscripta atroalba]|nr:hypothetical protein [Lignoscripta atroalba]